MNPHLKSAVLEFLADEYKALNMPIVPETNFANDLHLSTDEQADLFHRLEDALSLVIPEEKVPYIMTVNDLILILDPEETEDEAGQ